MIKCIKRHKKTRLQIESEEASASQSFFETGDSPATYSLSERNEMLHNYAANMLKIKRNSQLYLELSSESYFFVEILVNTSISQLHILLTLKKVRLKDLSVWLWIFL